MFDNGLFEKFKHTKTRDGILDMSEDKDFTFTSVERNIWKLSSKDGLYFAKPVNKSRMDAEVLLGQLHNQVGLNAAIYFPCQNLSFQGSNLSQNQILDLQNSRYAVSNNVLNSSSVLALDCYDSFNENNGLKPPMPYLFFSANSAVDYTKYFTKDAMRQLIKSFVFGITEYNYDMHWKNIGYEVSEGIVKNVFTFDNGASGLGAKRVLDDQEYCSFLQPEWFNRNSSLVEIKENPVVNQIISNREIANDLGSVDVVETSKDISKELGYKFSSFYVDKLARAYDETAELFYK